MSYEFLGLRLVSTCGARAPQAKDAHLAGSASERAARLRGGWLSFAEEDG